MPKLKTHKGAAKRLRLSKGGKVMRMKAGHNHFRSKNASNLNSDLRHPVSSTIKSIVKLVKTVAGKNAAK
jgi:large subunit ribosomal protein L35